MSSTDTDVYTRCYADRYGRIVAVEGRSTRFPVHCDDPCDPALHYLGARGERCDKTILQLNADPPLVDGIIEVYVGAVAVLHAIPAGSFISEALVPVAEFEADEDFAFGSDMPGAHALLIESPRHLPLTITVRVIPVPVESAA